MAQWKVNIEDVPAELQQWSWEDGSYERTRRHISVALGNAPDGTHPFDVELTRLASGAGKVHRNGEVHVVKIGDCFMQPPGTRHRVYNASDTEDFLYYVIANEIAQDSVIRHQPWQFQASAPSTGTARRADPVT